MAHEILKILKICFFARITRTILPKNSKKVGPFECDELDGKNRNHIFGGDFRNSNILGEINYL